MIICDVFSLLTSTFLLFSWVQKPILDKKLPPSSSYTSILVIVDCLSEQSLFIPTHDTIMSPQLAQLFILHIFSKHSVPSHVTSDHSMEFVSHFFWSLRTALDMKLHFTSRYHPKAMDKLNELIRLWNSTSKSIAITNNTIGLNSFH